MKALFVISTLGAGGAERAMSELAGFLAKRGWSILLVSFENETASDFYPLHPAVRRAKLGNPQPASSWTGRLAALPLPLRCTFHSERIARPSRSAA